MNKETAKQEVEKIVNSKKYEIVDILWQ